MMHHQMSDVAVDCYECVCFASDTGAQEYCLVVVIAADLQRGPGRGSLVAIGCHTRIPADYLLKYDRAMLSKCTKVSKIRGEVPLSNDVGPATSSFRNCARISAFNLVLFEVRIARTKLTPIMEICGSHARSDLTQSLEFPRHGCPKLQTPLSPIPQFLHGASSCR
jgi:hypothetical protein